MLYQLNPLVIVDEAHKMISQFSGEVMQRVNPACVIVTGVILQRLQLQPFLGDILDCWAASRHNVGTPCLAGRLVFLLFRRRVDALP